MESSEANMSPQEKYLATSGVIEELSTAIQSLFSREQLPENPYAALAALMRHQAIRWRTWSLDGAPKTTVAPNQIEGTKQDPELCHALGGFEFWGLAHVVRLVDSDAAGSLVKMVSNRVSVGGGQELEGNYALRHVLALGGDWVFAHRIVRYPGDIVLNAEYSVSGPELEAGLDMFVLRVLEDIVSIGHPEQENVADCFHIEKARKDDIATVAASLAKTGSSAGGVFNFGADKREHDAQVQLDAASCNTPKDDIDSDRWSIDSIRRTRQSFIAQVKAAIVANRRIWLTFYGLVTDDVAPVDRKNQGPADSATTTKHGGEAGGIELDDQLYAGQTEEDTVGRRYCRWRKHYTFHFQGEDQSMKNFCTHRHEALYNGVFFSRHDAEFYKSLFNHSYASAFETGTESALNMRIPTTFTTRVLNQLRDCSSAADGFGVLTSALHLLALGHRSQTDVAALLPNLHRLLHSSAAEYHSLASEARALADVLRNVILVDREQVDSVIQERRLLLVQGSFRGFRRRLIASISKHRHHCSDVANASSLLLYNVAKLYDKQQRTMLVTEQSVSLLAETAVFCEAVSRSQLDDLLECVECKDVVGMAVCCYLEVAPPELESDPQPESLGFFDRLGLNKAKNNDSAEDRHLRAMLARVPYIARPSLARASAAGRLYINSTKEQQRIISLHTVPTEVSQEAVYLQYAADTGLDRFLADVITDLTWKALPRNSYKVISDDLNKHVMQFDASHQSSDEVLASVLHGCSSKLLRWKDSKIYYLDDDEVDGADETDELYVCELAGSQHVLGSRLALSIAAVNRDFLWSLRDSLAALFLDDRVAIGAFSVDICTGLAGLATVTGSLVPVSTNPCPAVRLAQDVCIDGPDHVGGVELFIEMCAQHIVDMHENTDVIVSSIGGETESDSPSNIRDIIGADLKEGVASIVADALQEATAIRVEGFCLHRGLYTPFSKHIAFHYSGGGNTVDLATHVWPPGYHLHERLYFSENAAPSLFRRCRRNAEDKDWLRQRIQQLDQDDAIATHHSLGLSLAMAAIVPNGDDSVRRTAFVDCCRFFSSAAFHVHEMIRMLHSVRTLATEASPGMLAKIRQSSTNELYTLVAKQFRHYTDSSCGRAVFYSGGVRKLHLSLDLIESLLSVESLTDQQRLDLGTHLEYCVQFARLFFHATAAAFDRPVIAD